MAPNPLSSIAVTEFRDSFIVKNQAKEKLAGTSMEVHNVVGEAYKWPRIDGADLQPRGAYGSLIAPTILDHDRVTTTFEDYVLNLPVDRGEQTLVNVSERDQLASAHAMAHGRRKDYWRINALNQTTNIIESGGGGTNITLNKLIAARSALGVANADMSNLMIAIHQKELDALLKLTEVGSADYNTVRALVNGELNTFMGFKFIVFGDVLDKQTGANLGLPVAANIRRCFAWDPQALGIAFSLEAAIEVDWSPERVSWLSISQIIGGASILLDTNVVRIDCDES